VSAQDDAVQRTAETRPSEPPPPEPLAPAPGGLPSWRATQAASLAIARCGLSIAFGFVIAIGLFHGGLDLVPTLAQPALAEADATPRQPPIVPPSVPLGARYDWAWFTYVNKINEAWGNDWPFVIRLFEEFDARYPGDPVVFDKLYLSYIEDGRTLQAQGDLAGARRRYQQAAAYDPSRSEAYDYLRQLDQRDGGH
jgi:hypothetical protein